MKIESRIEVQNLANDRRDNFINNAFAILDPRKYGYDLAFDLSQLIDHAVDNPDEPDIRSFANILGEEELGIYKDLQDACKVMNLDSENTNKVLHYYDTFYYELANAVKKAEPGIGFVMDVFYALNSKQHKDIVDDIQLKVKELNSLVLYDHGIDAVKNYAELVDIAGLFRDAHKEGKLDEKQTNELLGYYNTFYNDLIAIAQKLECGREFTTNLFNIPDFKQYQDNIQFKVNVLNCLVLNGYGEDEIRASAEELNIPRLLKNACEKSGLDNEKSQGYYKTFYDQLIGIVKQAENNRENDQIHKGDNQAKGHMGKKNQNKTYAMHYPKRQKNGENGEYKWQCSILNERDSKVDACKAALPY